ncbi:MAG: response regulator transcription factor [Anaerolineales bacterium]|nr:response regulator transcription factor [Anaerolineales bacterium]
MIPVGVYIIDEHEPVRTALVERLGHAERIQIIGHTGLADMVVQEVTEKKPDIVLLEVKRSDGMGLELLRQLAALASPPKLVVLTSYPSSWEKDAASRAGAASYLLKDIESEDLIENLSLILEKK